MILETLSKAHADGMLQGILIAVLIMWGKDISSPWCWIVLAISLILAFVMCGINWRFEKIDKDEWPSACYKGSKK